MRYKENGGKNSMSVVQFPKTQEKKISFLKNNSKGIRYINNRHSQNIGMFGHRLERDISSKIGLNKYSAK